MTIRNPPIDYTGFLSVVEREAGVSRAEAERAVRAALQTLGERLSAGQARDIAEQLPLELREVLANDSKAQPFDAATFLRRVAEREGTDVATAERHSRAVFAALGRAVSYDELSDMAAELPKDFAGLLAAAEPPPEAEPDRPPPLAAEEFVARVAQRAGLDREAARRAIDAVLEALGQRITGGQVEDLTAQLPPELHPPLRRGDAQSHGAARRLSPADFVRVIAELEGVPPDQATEHARAVFATLREAVSPKELADTVAQLPDEYRALLARP
ncbi:MAG: hypothetical protein QOE86_4057 [Solirubrobacteraceae bacterium]|nr:hypothetical protein [Solirubrobacteraceae bacterium]